MLNNLGLPEMVVIVLFGLLIFGPDRLPKAAADAGRMIRQLRDIARNATRELKEELGPELTDLDLASLHPRRLVNEHLFGED